MFLRNRSAQLLELPLLSRFAADLRRHTRAFAYKPPHKIHNTLPRRAITTEDIHRSREFWQNRGGDSLADRRFSKQNLHVPPLSSLFQSCIGGASRSLCEGFPNLRRHCNEEGDVRTGNDECAHQTSTEKKEKGAEEEGTSGCSHDSSGETKKKRGILPNKWRLSAKNPRLLSVEVGETRSRLAVRRRMCNFATT